MRKLLLTPLLVILSALTACSGQAPTPETGAQVAHLTETAAGIEIKKEIRRLFDTLLEAFRTADAALLRSTMPQDLALLCTAESMEPWILENGPRIQAFELASVFIDAEDPDRGMAQLDLLPERDEAKPLQVESVRWFPITGVPFPLKREEGQWKAGYPVPQELPGCPYQPHHFVPSEPGVGPDYPNIPGLDFNMWDIPFRNPEPDSPDSFSQTDFRGSTDGMFTISSSTLQATDLSPGELVSRYRERLAHPSWNIREQGTGADASWFTWTVRDGENHLWFGTLTASRAGEGWQWVSLFLHSPELQRP